VECIKLGLLSKFGYSVFYTAMTADRWGAGGGVAPLRMHLLESAIRREFAKDETLRGDVD